jgi:hypothetical protein
LVNKMKKFSLIVLMALLASPAWAATYFLAPASGGGNDSNNGTSPSSPWLSPNHPVNCGDVISAAAGAYSAANFGSGRWGAVTCPGGNNVTWLKCATFDSCKISASGTDGMRVSASFWGVQGFEVTANGGSCFTARPSSSPTIHHIIFANDVANGCSNNGFNTFNNGSSSVDYIVVVGSIAYNAAQGSGSCYSGISIYQPVSSDTAPGTHILVAGNISYDNTDANPCAGGSPTDGEGLILDTFNGSQGGGFNYAQQAVAENNLFFLNGGRGVEVFENALANIYLVGNTTFGNNNDTHQNATYCGDHTVSNAVRVQVYNFLSMTDGPNGCGSNPKYAIYFGGGSNTNSAHDGWVYSATGRDEGANNNGSFAFGLNITSGTNPSFASTADPGPPNCGSASNAPNCMATAIANFTPADGAAKPYGYHIPSLTGVSDPLFPQWLCNVNLPPGLVTMGCATEAVPQPPTGVIVISIK